jgi:alpha-1,3-rhamnosyl/mannosyltransferase
MRIGFDVSPLHRAHSPGVARATAGLVAELEARGRHEIVRLIPAEGENLRKWRLSRLPQLARELQLDGIHSPVSAFPFRGPGWRVQTIHELPWKHGVGENADLRHRLWASLGVLRADRVICPSEHVARDLGRRAKLRVCPWGASADFCDEPPLGVVDEVALGRYSIGQDRFALCLGAVREKKNLAALLHGRAELRKQGGPTVHVVVSGPETHDLRRDLGLVSKLGLARFVSTPGEIDEEHLPALLRLATVVPVLSRSEGFAFPVLEAMACGTPVLVPHDSAQSELAGAAGIAVDPDDASSVAAGLERAVRERESLRPALAERAAAFTWQRCAEQVEELWTELR